MVEDKGEVPGDLRYTQRHEWIRLEGERITVGITDFAQRSLTDVVYVELPSVGKRVRQGDELAVMESVKSVSEVYAPCGGVVVEVNSELENKPEMVNEDPYHRGWIAVLQLDNPAEVDDLLTPEAYEAL